MRRGHVCRWRMRRLRRTRHWRGLRWRHPSAQASGGDGAREIRPAKSLGTRCGLTRGPGLIDAVSATRALFLETVILRNRYSSLRSAPRRLSARVHHIHSIRGQTVTLPHPKQLARHRPPRAAPVRRRVPTWRDGALHVARRYVLVDAIGGRAAQPHLHSRMKKIRRIMTEMRKQI